MPLQKIKQQSLEQFCAGCGQVNVVDYALIELGVSAEGGARKNTNVILLPPCPACGAVENLVRTWDDASGVLPPGHQLEHRKVVNRLADMLKKLGRVNAGCAAEIELETEEPPNTHPDTPNGPSDEVDIGPPPWSSAGEKEA
jgi:hypothetical protein